MKKNLKRKVIIIFSMVLITSNSMAKISLAKEETNKDSIPKYTITCPSGNKHRMERNGNALAIYLNGKEIWKDSYKATYVCSYCNVVICVRDHPVNYYSPIGDYVCVSGYGGIKDWQYIYVNQTYHESGTQLDGYDFIN